MIETGKKNTQKVLIIDDEVDILESLSDLLRKEFHVFASTDIDEAIQLLEREQIAAIMTDQRMPKATGVEVLSRVTRISPETIRILFTGYSDIEAVINAVNEGRIYHYISKPWDSTELLNLVRNSVEHFDLIMENQRLIQELAEFNRIIEKEKSVAAKAIAEKSGLKDQVATLSISLQHIKDSYWFIRRFQECLPICMHCGKVKNDSGNWEEVVDFLKNNSLFLTHGYCPECAKLYEI